LEKGGKREQKAYGNLCHQLIDNVCYTDFWESDAVIFPLCRHKPVVKIQKKIIIARKRNFIKS